MHRLPRLVLLLVLCATMAVPVVAQENRRSGERAGVETIDGSTLKVATLSYDATMKMNGRSMDLASTQTVAKTSTGGTDTWTLVNKIERPQGPLTDSLIMDRSSLLPLSRHRHGGAGLALTYTGPSATGEVEVSGTMNTGDQSKSISKQLNAPTLAGGVHDVIALGAMPLEPGFEAALPVFSPQDQATKQAEFEVVGTESVTTPAGSFETYVVDLTVGDGYVTGTVHLRKNAPHYYVKWETEVSAGRGTRTITQTLSSMEMEASPSAQ